MYNVLKSTLLLTLVLALYIGGVTPTLSQITVTVGGGTTFFGNAGNFTPFTAQAMNFTQLLGAGRTQLFYSAAELTSAGLTPGLITSVAFRTNSTAGNPVWTDGQGDNGFPSILAYYLRFRTTTVPAASWTNFDLATTAVSMGAYNPLSNFVGAYRTPGGHFINASGTQNNVIGGPGNGWQKYDFGQTGIAGGFANPAVLTTDVQNGVQWNGTENIIVDIYARANFQGWGGFFTLDVQTSMSNISFTGARGTGNAWQANGAEPDPNLAITNSDQSTTQRAVMQLTYRPLGLEDIFPDDVTGKNTLSNEGLAGLNEAPVYDDPGAWSLANQEPAPYFSFRVQQSTQFFFRYRIEAVNVTGEPIGPDPNGGPALPAMPAGTVVYSTATTATDTNQMWARTTPAFGPGTQVFLIQMTDIIGNAALYNRSLVFPTIDAGPVTATVGNFGSGQAFEKGDPTIADGALVLRSTANAGAGFAGNVPKGTYRAVAMLRIPSQASTSYASKLFFIRYSKDLAVLRINQPKQPILPDNVTYPRGVGLPVQATFANVAKENAGMFRARMQIYWDRDTIGAPSANIANDSLIWADTASWRKQLNGSGAQVINGLASGDSVDFDFNSIPGNRLTNVGDYYVRVFVELQDSCEFGNGVPICNPINFGNFIDQQNFNDSMPRQPMADHIFRVQPNNEVQSVQIQRPQGTIVVRRPVQVRSLFRNNGKSSAEFNPVRVHAINAATNVLEFNNTTTVDIPPTPPYNERVAVFPGLWQPQNVGTYNIKVFSEAATDELRSNDTAYTTVTVLPALTGTYTIGLTNVGHPTLGPRNYASLNAALDDLYFRGIEGDVRYEFTDDNRSLLPANDPYIVGNINNLAISGLDLRSRIISKNTTDKITFTVSAARAQVRGSVVIRMRAANGIGVHFGQTESPANANAVQIEFPQPVNKFANSNGNITFEGGPNKSLRLELQATTDIVQNAGFRAAVYFDRGSVNNAVRNCLISTTAPSQKDSLPLPLQYTPSGSGRTFPDEFNRRVVAGNNVARSYSAGILNRNVLPFADSSGSNPNNLDTIINTNNQMVGNVIQGGFGYGIVSLGIDYEQQGGNWTRMYNRNTLIQNNWISGCFTGGIYVGNEENCQIIGNRIDSIRRPTVVPTTMYTTTFGGPNWNNLTPIFDRGTFGIQAGGDTLYSFINLRIVGNEVSNIISSRMATGILVEQSRNVYGGSTVFPSAPARSYIANNIVWGIGAGPSADPQSVNTVNNAPRAGIMVTTRRRFRSLGGNLNTDLGLGGLNVTNYFNPQAGNQGLTFFTEGDTIINNTVVIGNDQAVNGGSVITNGGVTTALGVQNALSPVIWNNALSVVDNNVDINTSFVHSALFLQGITSRDTVRGARTDYNAYFTPFNAATVRFVRTDVSSGLFDGLPVASTNTEFQVLRQWRSWVGRDLNSVNGDFVSNHEVVLGNAITPRKLRVKTNPLPTNSVLNNRGVVTNSLSTDIDVFPRGNGGQAYDIGANEFNGASLPTDVEVVDIASPVAYKAEIGGFSDAEHIMTTFPVTFTAVVRNAGNQNLTNVPVTLTVRVETSASNNTVTTASVVTPIGSMFPARSFSSTAEINQTVTVPSLPVGESRLVVFSTPTWVPRTYGDTNASMRPYITPNKYTNGGTVAARMSTMFHNVTPRYQVVVTTPSDDNPANNLAQKEVRFYRIQAGMQVIASVTGMGAATPIGNPARLNADSLITNMDTLGLGWRIDTNRTSPAVRRDYDVFDRGSWEIRAVNYRPYRTMFWAHGGNATLNSNVPDGINTAGSSPLNRFERDDLRDYFNTGTQIDKKQFVVASQEIVPGNARRGAAFDKEFVEDYLRADTMRLYYPAVAGLFGPSSNPNPNPENVNGYNNRQFIGRSVNFSLVDTIAPTGVVGDPITAVHPAIMRPYTGPASTGLATTAGRYTQNTFILPPPTLSTLRDSIMGIALATPTYNAITIGVDWRHIRKSGVGPGFRPESGVLRLLRGAIDFFDRNGGWVVPVELVEFEATGLNRSVDVRWATAQEVNSGYFEVERAKLENGLRSSFEKIANVSASGNSQSRKDYGVIDNNVTNGVTYVYRLRIVDKDGSFDYSGEQIVSFGTEGTNWIGEVSPNPVQSIANFDVHVATDEATEVTLFDMSGRKVATLLSVSKAGVHSVRLDAMNLPSGMYTVSMTSSKETITRQIQVVK